MHLDIVIPTLNERENLSSLIPFLETNISQSTNIYIVDSPKSTDRVSTLIDRRNVHYIRSQHTRRSSQMNEGARMGTGDTLLFLHADVKPPQGFENHIKGALANGFKTGFFSYMFDQSSFFLKINEYFTKYDGLFAGGGDQCHFFTRGLFTKMQGYKESQEIMEDFEMIDRLKKEGVQYTIIQNPATVSARKYKNNSYLWVNLINLITYIKFRTNVPASEIKDFYKRALN